MRNRRVRKYVGFSRGDRVSASIRRIVASMAAGELADPRLAMTSITGVDMSPDNHVAKIYFSLLGEKESADAALAGFNAAASLFKRRIADELRLRTTPELRFIHDKTLEYADEMNRLFLSIQPEPAPASDGPEGEETDRVADNVPSEDEEGDDE